MQNLFIADRGRYVWLDLIRGLSALAVCVGHLRAALFLDFSELSQPGVVLRLFYFATGLGHQAVMVFFVLSGFFVGGSVLNRGVRFSLGHYALSRLSRLWIVLVPALFLTAVVDFVLASTHPEVLGGAYRDLWNSGPEPSGYSRSLLTLLGNMFFLQTLLTPVFGTNGPLWSLANEFWYYVLFPLFAMGVGLAGGRRAGMLRAASVLLALTIVWWLPVAMRLGFLVWLLGVFVSTAHRRFSRISRVWSVLALVIFSGTLVYSKSAGLPAKAGLWSDLVVGLGFAPVCLVASRAGFQKWKPVRAFSVGLSEISYSLYLSHFPLVLLLAVTVCGRNQLRPTLINWLLFFGLAAGLVTFSAVFWHFFESRTQNLRALFDHRFKRLSLVSRSMSAVTRD